MRYIIKEDLFCMMTANNSTNLNQTLDLNKIYGIDDATGAQQPYQEDLTNYIVNQPWDTSIDKVANINMPTARESLPSREAKNSDMDLQAKSDLQSPRRQEQTFPTSRDTSSNTQNLDGNNQIEKMQLSENLNSFLRTQIGKNVSMQFLVGTNALVEKSGTLVGLGSNYVILRESGTDEILICDLNDVKFIRLENN